MTNLPKSLQSLIDNIAELPGVGSRTAERYAYFLLKSNPKIATDLSSALLNLHMNVTYCPVTFALIDTQDDVSPLYSDPKRNKKIIAVVSEPFDIIAFEKTGLYNGTYHVLGGLISPIDGIGPEDLHIKELISRIDDDKVEEIILATNASVEGESTALYLQNCLIGKNIKLTRLARGLPIGVDIEYADQITLGRALEGRQQVS